MSNNKEKAFINSRVHARAQAKIEEEERELEELLKGSQQDEDETEDEVQEESEEETEDKATPTNVEDDKPLSSEEQTFKKRYGDLRKHSQKEKKELEAELKELKTKLASKEETKIPKSEEEIREWYKQYPDVASIFEQIAENKVLENRKEVDERFKVIEERESDLKRKEAEDQIRAAHKDFDKLKESDDFHEWVGDQSKWIQDALYENADDPRAVISVIDLYKTKKGLTTSAKNRDKKEAAMEVSTTSKVDLDAKEKPKFKESQVERMSIAEYEKNETAILEAQREGRFIYDLSAAS